MLGWPLTVSGKIVSGFSAIFFYPCGSGGLQWFMPDHGNRFRDRV